jgi:hypothetical protein
LVFVEELAAVALVGSEVLSGEDGGLAGEAVSGRVEGRTLFAGGGAGAGGEPSIRAVRASAMLWGWGLGVRDWGGGRVYRDWVRF